MAVSILREVNKFRTCGLVSGKKINQNTLAYCCKVDDFNYKPLYTIDLNEKSQIKAITCEDETITCFYPQIPHNKRFVWLVSAGSGTGKTIYGSLACIEYLRLTKNPVYFFCGKTIPYVEMETFKPILNLIDKNRFIQVDLSDENVYNKDLYSNCMCLFDDIDTHEKKKKILNLMNSCAEIGREINISVMFITHVDTHGTTCRGFMKDVNFYSTVFNNIYKDGKLTNRFLTNYTTVKLPDYDHMYKYYSQSLFMTINLIGCYLITDDKIEKLN